MGKRSKIAETGREDQFVEPGEATFGIKHRLFRMAWSLVWTLTCRWTPPPLRPWRIAVLNAFGADVDRTAMVYPTATIWYPPNLTMGPRSTLGPGVNCYCMDKITVGEGAIVSQSAFLCGGTHDIDRASFPLVIGPISIGARAWVAAEAFVAPGVTIEEGAVLGARGVATKDLQAFGVYAGNPAQHVRQRRLDQDSSGQ